jgi:DNA-binding CsgD family transcriptional regulator
VSWDRLPAIYRSIAQTVCTPAELDALAHHLAGYTDRQIAHKLGVSRRAIRYRLERATQKIADHPDMPKETECA